MRRWEARLARLEEFARWLVRLREEKRTEPQRIARWMAWLARNDPAPATCRPEAKPKDLTLRQGPVATLGPSPDAPSNSCRPKPSGEGPNVPTGPLVEPLGPSLRSGRQGSPPPPPPPPRPLVEFIQERAGMSIAIDTRTGQMADSATVMAALAQMPRDPPDK